MFLVFSLVARKNQEHQLKIKYRVLGVSRMPTSFIHSLQHFYTTERLTEGHPDKLCDQISDAILDAFLAQDPRSRVACETGSTTGLVVVMGEVTAEAYVEIQEVARKTIR